MKKIDQYEFSIEIDEYIFNRFVKDKVRKPYNNYEDYKDTYPNCVCNFILRDKKHLMNYIKRQLDPNRKLVKLSLCWSCSKHMVNKYPCIKESIFKDNGKYFFGSWA